MVCTAPASAGLPDWQAGQELHVGVTAGSGPSWGGTAVQWKKRSGWENEVIATNLCP